MEDVTGLFNQFKSNILNVDPVYFCENFLTVDGKPLALKGTGFKPFSDIYRYIGLKAIKQDAKPIVLVKGRQVGATTMAAALECYFTACGIYGKNGKPPMRLMHIFPTLSLAAAYTKDKLDPMIGQSVSVPGILKANGLLKSYMENKLDLGSPTNNNMHFKKFLHGNQIWIESTGLDGDRIRGRMLALDTVLPTPDQGFIKLKDLKEGDKLFDENGNVCNVTKLHPIDKSPESYRITFDDRTTIDACADHLWLTYTKKDRNINSRNTYKLKRRNIRRVQGLEHKPFLEREDRKPTPTVKTTKEILETLKCGIEYNHSIPVIPFAKYEEKKLPIDPYILGAWLGDGASAGGLITSADPEMFEGYDHHIIPSSINIYNKQAFSKDGYSKANNYRIVGLTTKLRKLNLLNNKHIPDIYLYSSFEQRLALLQGLMDTDGCCYKDGRCDFTQVDYRKRLVFQVKELISSLGIKCKIIKKKSMRYDVRYNDKYQILFSTNKPVFKLNRKRQIQEKTFKNTSKRTHRFIRSIEPIPSVPMRCITVDSPSHLYLVTRSYIPTHNTVDGCFFDECFPYKQNILTENGVIQIGKLYEDFIANKKLPKVKTYNEITDKFEYKNITNAWNRGEKELVELIFFNGFKIKCTPDHRFLTTSGWLKAREIDPKSVLVKGISINSSNTCIYSSVKNVKYINKYKTTYDLEVEDNHNFIVTNHIKISNSLTEYSYGFIAHNCQDMNDISIGAVTKILAQSQYGARGEGIQVYFGTPKTKNGSYWGMWKKSTQNYYYLHCEKCNQFFPLYHPDIKWEDIWIYGFTVKCPECGHEQDKLQAQERGKWIPTHEYDDCTFAGYHINQLYIPNFARETIEKQKPENSPINTERIFMNEVLGEFYDGESGTISEEEIRDKCLEPGRAMVKYIYSDSNKRTYAGFDWGQRSLLQQAIGRTQGRSYSCSVILTAESNLFNIEFATRLTSNTPEAKEETVEEMYRRYNLALAVGDIGDAGDLSHRLKRKFEDRFLASRAVHRINGHIKFADFMWPQEIQFEKDYYISELLDLLRSGRIKFPGKNKDRIDWLIKHCASMEVKITKDKSGEPLKKFVKGATANDGMMALLNAYLAWKFDVTGGFSIKDPAHMQYGKASHKATTNAVLGYVPRLFGSG